MNEKEKKHISKFLSLVLRHQPETIELELDENGWANVSELLEKSKKLNICLSVEDLEVVVFTNDKQRFAFNEDMSEIRANQGHSVTYVDLKFESLEPPKLLFHGTVEKFMPSILNEGLQKMSRQFVHLSRDIETARNVGGRRGKPVILKIDARRMHQENHHFYKSENDVWLTDVVPVEFIIFE